MSSQGQVPRLDPLPSSFETTRRGLHLVAERIVAPARRPDNEISLRATPGGFGTPPFEHGGSMHQVRVEDAQLVHSRDGSERRTTLESLTRAGELVAELLPGDSALDDSPLGIESAAAEVLASWFELGRQALAALRAEAPDRDEPTIPRLWPEHFDIAIESGSEVAGRRANYGFSPGDADHREPYAYVGPWSGEPRGELWNATGFSGAELGYEELAGSSDPLAASLDFCRARREALERGFE